MHVLFISEFVAKADIGGEKARKKHEPRKNGRHTPKKRMNDR